MNDDLTLEKQVLRLAELVASLSGKVSESAKYHLEAIKFIQALEERIRALENETSKGQP